jgi:cytoskeletal protein CcmA (bactofilin family)
MGIRDSHTEPLQPRQGTAVSPALATIGSAVRIVGQIFSKEDLYLNGDVEGSLAVQDHKLTVGPNANVRAGVKAREVLVLGSIRGNVEASERIEIFKDGSIVGDIRTSRIVIEDGAFFKGGIDIVRKQPTLLDELGSTEGAPAPAANNGR